MRSLSFINETLNVFLLKVVCPSFYRILVNMDDMMVEQFVDEDDFVIQVNFDNQLGHFELTFVY